MEFRLLGTVGAAVDGTALPVRGTRLKALLACLALRCGKVVATDRLIEDLWNGEAPPRAPDTLKSHMSHLRRALGDDKRELIVSHPPGYVLRAEASSVDALRFERLVADGRVAAGGGDHAGAVVVLDDALALFTDRPLADLDDVDFAAREADRLDQLRLQAVEQWCDSQLIVGHHDPVVARLDALVDEHPLRERLTGLLMLALYRSGRQADALRRYRSMAERLVDELGVSPTEELRDLEHKILSQSPELSVATPVVPARPPEPARAAPPLPAPLRARVRRRALVGRDDELAGLAATWKEVQDGTAELVVISGPAGIGKSRLAAEQAAAAHGDGAVVLHGQCDEDGTVPFQPFLEGVAALGEAVPAPGQGRDGSAATDDARHQFFDAMTDLLARWASHAPLLFVIDDIQWADRGSLLLLRHVLRRFPPRPFLVLATRRFGDLAAPGASALDTLSRDGLRREVRLGPLTDEHAAVLVRRELPGADTDLDADTESAILTLGRGNPLVLAELGTHADQLRDLDATVTGTVGLSAASPVHRVVALRFTELDDNTRAGLAVAAAIGPSFEAATLFDVLGDQAYGVIDRSLLAQVTEPVSPARPTYRFTHALLRDVAHSMIDSRQRRDTHRRIADALERRARLDPTRWAGELAHHLRLAMPAVPTIRLVHALRGAGDAAMRALAFEEAGSWYEQAVEQLSTWGLHDDALHTDLHLAIGRARVASGAWEAAKEAYARAADLARACGDPHRMAEAALGYRGDYHGAGGGDPQLEYLTLDALARLPGDETLLRAHLMAQLAVARFHAGSDDITALADDALDLALAGQHPDPRAVIACLHACHTASWTTVAPGDRLPLATEMLRRGIRAGDTAGAQMARWNLVLDHFELGRTTDALRWIHELRRTADRSGRTVDRWWATMFSAAVLGAQGRADEALDLAAEAAACGARLCSPDAELFFATQVLMISWTQGRVGDLRDEIERLARRDPPVQGLPAALAVLHAETGELDRARRLVSRATHPAALAALRPDRTRLAFVALLAHAACVCGDRDAAAALEPELAPAAGRQVVLGPGLALLGPVSLYLGRIADVLDRPGVAATRLAAAEDEAARWDTAHWAEVARRARRRAWAPAGGPPSL